jgi:hypothetical protein
MQEIILNAKAAVGNGTAAFHLSVQFDPKRKNQADLCLVFL